MKLLTKTGLNFISASIFFFVFGSLGGYYFIRFAVDKMFDNELKEAAQEVKRSIGKGSYLLSYADVSVDTLQHQVLGDEFQIRDTLVINQSEGNYEYFRLLSFHQTVNDHHLRVTLRRSLAAPDLMVMKFTLMLTVFPVLFFLILYLVNRGSVKYSLRVFYDTIEKLKFFDVNKDNRLELMVSDIDEFEQLNEVFNAMDHKIKEDYERLKEYTENTSHELQTPLAIIISQLDQLLQADNLTEEQVKQIAGLLETASRLSKINQALIYLAKLDNRVFSNEEEISVARILREHLEQLEPMAEEANLKIEITRQGSLMVLMNVSLAHALVMNLLKNAIRHNVQDGYIRIEIKEKQLRVTNSGKPLDFEPEKLFSRFQKNSQHPQSLGLGLSIVKRICEISDIDITYQQVESEHSFTLRFK